MTPLPLTSTLRLQFHKEFTLDAAIPLLPYFRKLGISHLYASPLLASTPGSMHGYDTIDCHRIDPERGGIDGLRRLVSALRDHGMGLILDIVPNHMGVGAHNAWWMDVLRHGPQSLYAQHFDIDWNPSEPSLRNKVLLPFLGDPLHDVLDRNGLAVGYPQGETTLHLLYGDQTFPLDPASLPASLTGSYGPEDTVFAQQLASLFDSRTKSGRDALESLLNAQHYRLAWWRVAGDLINWRRFFDVTSLIALRMDRKNVFDDAHRLVFDLYREGLIDGLRVDHVDGLARPGEYCTRLRARLDMLRRDRPEGLRETAPFFIEKILQKNEILPLEWPVTGTTGYDFLEQVSLLLHHPEGEQPVSAFWSTLGPADYQDVEHITRQEKLDTSFVNEFETLVAHLAGEFAAERDLTRHAIAAALRAVLIVFPVYRSYFADGGDSGADFRAIDRARLAAQAHLPAYQHPVLDHICQYLADARIDTGERQDILERFEHLTAPLTAKAGEDTAFYRYARLLSRNDVGCDPERFSASVACFHAMNRERLANHPGALLTTATHDHKRGEDGRARLAVLSEPEAHWPETARSWLADTQSALAMTSHGLSPVPADAYFILQTLISAWPVTSEDLTDLPERLDAYLTKALREAGERTGWSNPDDAYEQACLGYARTLLDEPFRSTLNRYIDLLAPASALNGLSQTLLRLTSPGVPDLYQGRECWDFSLVDPDNRRPVNYGRHEDMIDDGLSCVASASDWRTGRVKQALVERGLALRASRSALFEHGTYCPVQVTGPLSAHIVVFVREYRDEACLIIAPRLTMALQPDDTLSTHHAGWTETSLSQKGEWQSLFHDTLQGGVGLFSLSYLAGTIPLDILVRKKLS